MQPPNLKKCSPMYDTVLTDQKLNYLKVQLWCPKHMHMLYLNTSYKSFHATVRCVISSQFKAKASFYLLVIKKLHVEAAAVWALCVGNDCRISLSYPVKPTQGASATTTVPTLCSMLSSSDILNRKNTNPHRIPLFPSVSWIFLGC